MAAADACARADTTEARAAAGTQTSRSTAPDCHNSLAIAAASWVFPVTPCQSGAPPGVNEGGTSARAVPTRRRPARPSAVSGRRMKPLAVVFRPPATAAPDLLLTSTRAPPSSAAAFGGSRQIPGRGPRGDDACRCSSHEQHYAWHCRLHADKGPNSRLRRGGPGGWPGWRRLAVAGTGATSRPGFWLKNLAGMSMNPIRTASITGQSSGRGMWWLPIVCQTTTSVSSVGRSARVQTGSPSGPGS